MSTSFKTRLQDALNPITTPPAPWVAIDRVLREDPRLDGDAMDMTGEVLVAAVAAVSACRNGREIGQLPSRMRRILMTNLWANDHSLYESPPVMEYVSECLRRVPPKPVEIRRIARASLNSWRPDLQMFKAVAAALDRCTAGLGGGLAMVQAWGAFKPDGPERLASQLLGPEDRSIADVLHASGLSSVQQRGGFAREMFSHLCGLVEQAPSPNHYARLLDFALIGEELRFEGDLDRLARACLRPWVKRNPDDAGLQTRLLDFLRDQLGDLRFHPGNWAQVDEVDKKVVRRWLASESLQMFLDVVGDTAEEHMWRYRRAFWDACFDSGVIDDAWVIFGPNARAALRRRQELGRAGTKLAFGSLSRSDPSQSVLLMKIGDCTLVEWSHNGKIWMLDPVPGRAPPRLYSKQYNGEDCRGFDAWARFETSHTSAANWNWQYKVSRQILAITGVRINQKDSMP